MFRAVFSPIIRSTWLYLQYLLVFTQVAAGWCLEWDETSVGRKQFQLFRYTSRQQLGWTLPDTVSKSSAPDDGRKHRPKHEELTCNNKLIYIVHLVGYFHRWKKGILTCNLFYTAPVRKTLFPPLIQVQAEESECQHQLPAKFKFKEWFALQ